VLLDLKLPYVMGLDVLKWIRQQPELSPIVLILSASSEVSDISMAYHLGANGYVVKPPELRQLDAIVKSINNYWLTHNTPPSQPNVQPIMAGLAKRCREQAPAAVNDVEHGACVESILPPRGNRRPTSVHAGHPLVPQSSNASSTH
jgi:CheY-like chemotaxis protein